MNSDIYKDEKKGGDRLVTARQFILQILIPLREAWGYIYGYAGVKWTSALQDKIEQTTDENRQASRQYGSQWIGRMVTDCSGLLRWALRQLGLDIVHHARYQYTSACQNKGTLVGGKRSDGKAILPGTAVFLKGDRAHIHHVGVYVGSGICVEAKGARYGVVTSELSHWDFWGELQMVDYTDAAALEGAIEIPQRGDSAGGDTPVSGMRAVVNNPRNYLNLRTKPDSSSARLAQMPRGAVVEVIEGPGTHDEWWQVRFAGRIGWAWAEYLQLIEDNVEEPGDTDQVISAEPETAPSAASDAAPAEELVPRQQASPESDALEELRAIRDRLDQLITRLAGHSPDGGAAE